MKSIGPLDVSCFWVTDRERLLSFGLTVTDRVKLEITVGIGYFAIGKPLFGKILAHVL